MEKKRIHSKLQLFVCFQMPEKASCLRFKYLTEKLTSTKRNDLFLKNYVTSEGAVSHNVLYYIYQQLSVALIYQVSFYANIYFEQLPNVSWVPLNKMLSTCDFS